MSILSNFFSLGNDTAQKTMQTPEQDALSHLKNENEVLHSKNNMLETALENARKENHTLENQLKELVAGNVNAGNNAVAEQALHELRDLQARYDTLQAKANALEIVLENERHKAPPKTEVTPTGHSESEEQAHKQVEEMEEHMIHTAKLATLGQLVAGIAHEINTPIGAINAASTNLMKGIPLLLQNLPATLAEVDLATREVFYKLVDRGMNFKESLSSRDERNFKKQVTEDLEKRNIPNAAVIASGLVKMGVFDGLDEYLPLFNHPKVDQLIELASAAGKVKVNVDNINIAISKAMRINQGLKNFSHKSDPDKPELTDIKESIETVLTVYHNVLKYNVETTKNYDPDLPKTLAFPDELSQVWANLIQNAAQAMNAAGKLSIDVQTEHGNVIRVDIADSGPGIPKDIQEKIWQPFFTTKKKGEGTGLGLDIVKRIVTKHGGTITLASKPGSTTFTVRLPVKTVPDMISQQTNVL